MRKNTKRLSRKQQIVLHLLLLAALCVAFVYLSEYPFRVAQRELSAFAAEQGVQETTPLWKGSVAPSYGYGSWIGGEPLVLVRGGDQLLTYQFEKYENLVSATMHHCPWPRAGKLVFLPQPSNMMPGNDSLDGLLAVNLPEGTASGQVVLDMGPEDQRTMTATRESDAIFFWVEARDWLRYDEERNMLRTAPYQLTLLDEDGQVLLSSSGTLDFNWEERRG